MKNTVLKLLPVAVAVAGLSISSGAFASLPGGTTSDDDTQKETTTTSDTTTTSLDIKKNLTHNVTDNINVGGNIVVDSQATSLGKSVQDLNAVTIDKSSSNFNQSDIQDESFGQASGVATLNVGSGAGYAQDNAISLAVALSPSTDTANTALDAETFNQQSIENSSSTSGATADYAFIKNDAFTRFSGLANVNDGAGDLYAQSNDLALSVGVGPSATATAYSQQELESLSSTTNGAWSSQSGLIDNAFSNATGLLSVNVGSGTGFAQNNSLSFTSATLAGIIGGPGK